MKLSVSLLIDRYRKMRERKRERERLILFVLFSWKVLTKKTPPSKTTRKPLTPGMDRGWSSDPALASFPVFRENFLDP